MAAKEDEVGYGRPPKSSRFKPGVSGNPKGRRRKEKPKQKSIEELVAEIADETHEHDGKIYTVREVIARSIVKRAVKGDPKAIAQYLDMEKRRLQEIEKTQRQSGVLFVPAPMDMDSWSAAAAAQQAKFRNDDPEGLAELNKRVGIDFGTA